MVKRISVRKVIRDIGFATALIAAGVILCGGNEEYTTVYKTHIVSEGQTVWGIATYYLPEQDRTRHLGEFASDIARYNGIKNAYIFPGQALTIPLDIKKR